MSYVVIAVSVVILQGWCSAKGSDHTWGLSCTPGRTCPIPSQLTWAWGLRLAGPLNRGRRVEFSIFLLGYSNER